MRAWILANTSEGLSRVLGWGLLFFPVTWLIYLGTQDQLTANPVEYVTRQLGTWALIFLLLTLSMTPLRALTQSPVWIRRRRLLGLSCFAYALLHFGVWALLDHQGLWEEMLKDILKRPYLTFGAMALILLVPLALTSNQWSIRALGPRWKKLHRWVYAIVILGVIHLYFHKAGKHDFAKVWIYGSLAAGLLGYRVMVGWRLKSSAVRRVKP